MRKHDIFASGLKDGTRLVGVRDRETGYPTEVYDDGEGQIWVFGREFGPSMFIRARSFEAAWSIMLDESPTIAEDEVAEAYGFYGDDAAEQLRAAAERAEADGEDYPELEEGYELQDNCSGTGIVDVGHYAWLRELAPADLEKHRLVVRDDDEECEAVQFEAQSFSYTMRVRGVEKTFNSYNRIGDMGERLRKLERAIGACDVAVTWRQD